MLPINNITSTPNICLVCFYYIWNRFLNTSLYYKNKKEVLQMVSEEIKRKIDKFINSSWERIDYRPLFQKTIKDPVDGCSLEDLIAEITKRAEENYPTNKTQEYNLLTIIKGLFFEVDKNIESNAKAVEWKSLTAQTNQEARKIFHDGYQEERRLFILKSDLACPCILSGSKSAKDMSTEHLLRKHDCTLSDSATMLKHIERDFSEPLREKYMAFTKFADEKAHEYVAQRLPDDVIKRVEELRNEFLKEFQKQSYPQELKKENNIAISPTTSAEEKENER